MTARMSMKKLAELAGVSRGTVDKVINGRPGVNPSTKEKILEIAKALNYQPNIIGKALVSTEPVKIGIILTPDYNPFIVEMLKGIRQAEQEYSLFNLGVSVQMMTTLEPAEQISLLNSLKVNGVHGIAIFPTENEQVKDLVNSYVNEGIPIITFNSRAEFIKSICFVGQNHIKGGSTAAGLMNKILPFGGEVGIIVSSYNLSCHKNRLSGFNDALTQKNSNIKVVEVSENQDSWEKAFEITLEYYNRHPKLSGIYITGGGIAGCAKALQILKKEKITKLICHDLTPEARELLISGTLDFAIDQNPQLQGYQLVKVLFEYIFMKKTPEDWIEIPIGIITQDSL